MKRFHETDETNSFLLNVEELKSPVRKMDGSKLGPIPRIVSIPFSHFFSKYFNTSIIVIVVRFLVGGEYEKTGLVLKRRHGV